MPRRHNKKSKYVTKRGLPFMMMRMAEAKHVNQEVQNEPINSGLIVTDNLTAIGRGDTAGTRIGNEVQVTGLYCTGFFSPSHDDTFPTSSAYMGRVVLYTPRQEIDATLDPLPGENIDKDKYIVWYDRLVNIPWTNSVSGRTFTIKKKFKPYMKVIWDGAGSVDVTKNGIHLVITANSGTDLVEVTYRWRMYFRDL